MNRDWVGACHLYLSLCWLIGAEKFRYSIRLEDSTSPHPGYETWFTKEVWKEPNDMREAAEGSLFE